MAFGKLFGGMALSKILWEPPLQGPWSTFCCSGGVQTGTDRRAALPASPGTGHALGTSCLPLNTFSRKGPGLVLPARTIPASGSAALEQPNASERSSSTASTQPVRYGHVWHGGEGCTAALRELCRHGPPAHPCYHGMKTRQ